MPIGKIQPPTAGIQEEPTICIEINKDWATQLLGIINPARYPEWWGGTLEENRFARAQIRELMYIISLFTECGDMSKFCCVEQPAITRVNPDGGTIQISYDGGDTWENSPQTIQNYITIPIPPVTSGVADTKCDAATNVQTQVQAWIDQVLTDFDTATTLLDFALGIAEAILGAVLAILSAGTLTVAEALVLPIIAAAATATFGAGKVAFEDYWTPEALSSILCAAVCCIADDGSFNEAQFNCFWNKCNVDLPVGPAKLLFMGFLSSVGASGLSAMAASGTSADSDCSDCTCSDFLRVFVSSGGGTEISWDGESLIAEPTADGDHWTLFCQLTGSGFDVNACGYMGVVEILSGTVDDTFYQACGGTGGLLSPGLGGTCTHNANQIAIRMNNFGQVRIQGTPVSC